jgi:hypothetical protein
VPIRWGAHISLTQSVHATALNGTSDRSASPRTPSDNHGPKLSIPRRTAGELWEVRHRSVPLIITEIEGVGHSVEFEEPAPEVLGDTALMWRYVLLGLASGIGATLAVMGFGAGVYWLWLFGDDPWPGWAEAALVGGAFAMGLAAFVGFVAVGSGRGRGTSDT